MKFIKGFLIGSIFGVAVGSSLSERQRREITARASAMAKSKLRPVGQAVARNADEVTDAAVSTVESKIDDAGDAVADAIDTTDGSSSDTAGVHVGA